jgi:hypothetical protein
LVAEAIFYLIWLLRFLHKTWASTVC